MSAVLPQQINYTEPMSSLSPDAQSIEIACSPSNGQTFQQGSQIYCDFVSRGFLIPDSLFIRYNLNITLGAAGTASSIIGCPVYAPFSRVDVLVGSQTIDTIQSYNLLMHMMSNCTLDVAQKYGRQQGFGYLNSTGTVALEDLDGRYIGNTATTVPSNHSAPFMCVLSNSEKLIPLFAMPAVRVVLTLDSLTNFSTFTFAAGSSYTISNFELVYKIVDLGGNVQEIVRNMGDKIYIKSQSFSCATNSLATGTQGYVELVYNQRYASVKALLAINGCTGSANYQNKNFDSVDITNNNGEYSFMLGGVVYPQKALSTLTNKAGILEELRQAFGSIYDKTNAMSINSVEWNMTSTGSTTAVNYPGKFYVGVSTEKLGSNSLLTGVSTENSPISYRVSLGTATGQVHNITLIVNYDALWEIDFVNRQVSLKV